MMIQINQEMVHLCPLLDVLFNTIDYLNVSANLYYRQWSTNQLRHCVVSWSDLLPWQWPCWLLWPCPWEKRQTVSSWLFVWWELMSNPEKNNTRFSWWMYIRLFFFTFQWYLFDIAKTCQAALLFKSYLYLKTKL